MDRLIIDQKLRPSENILLSLSHILLMNEYVAPLIIAAAVGFGANETSNFMSVAFIGSGIATFLMAVVFMKYPLILGSSFIPMGAVISIILSLGYSYYIGAFLVSAILFFVLSLFRKFDKIIEFLIPKNIGAFIVIITGISLIPIALEGQIFVVDNYSLNENMTNAAITFVMMLVFTIIGGKNNNIGKFFKIAGTILAIAIGILFANNIRAIDLSIVSSAKFLKKVNFIGINYDVKFNISAIVTMFVLFIVMISENTGSFIIAQNETGVNLEKDTINNGFIGISIVNIISSLIGSIPVSVFSSNAGMIKLTGSFSRHIYKLSGIILLIIGLSGKLMAFLTIIPKSVIGGVFIFVAGMIVVSGIRMIDMKAFNEKQGYILAISIIISLYFSLIPESAFQNWGNFVRNLFSSSIAVGSITAMLLNKLIPEKV